MYSRHLKIIQLPQTKFLHIFLKSVFSEKSLFGKSVFCQSLPCNSTEFYEFNLERPILSFIEEDRKTGKELLNSLRISDSDWFICFHTRDSKYFSAKVDSSVDWGFHRTRDSDINTYLQAAEYITREGGFAIRMGYIVSSELETKNKKIIDYASNHRTDFGDIYLPANYKFFLGGSSGLFFVSETFHVPVAAANFTPLECTPFRKGDLFIPKRVWSEKEKRFLTFREMFDSDICKFLSVSDFNNAGLRLIENTPEEILDLAKEMNGRIDDTFKYTEEDEKLQKKYKSLIKPHHKCYGTPARIGADFLRKNKYLLT